MNDHTNHPGLLSLQRGLELIRTITERKDTLFVFSLLKSGDAVRQAAFCHHLKKFWHHERMALVSTRAGSVAAEMFSVFNESVIITEQDREDLVLVSQTHIAMYGENYIIGNIQSLLLTSFPGLNGLNMDPDVVFPDALSAFKTLILQIPYHYQAHAADPSFFDPYDAALAAKYRNSFLLAPYSESMPSAGEEYWLLLAKTLREAGYTVYTNVFGTETALEDTLRLELSHRETFNLLPYFRGVVSARSGFSDIMAFQPHAAHVVISYPDLRVMDFHDVSLYGISQNIVTLPGIRPYDELVSYTITALKKLNS